MTMNELTNQETKEINERHLAENDLTTDRDISTVLATAGDFDSAKVIGNILSLGSGEIIARAVAFIGTAYLARTLGPEGFGIIGFVTALFGYLALTVTAGFNDVGSREIARRPHEAPSIAASVIIVRLLLAFIALTVIVIAAWLINKPPTVKLVMVLMGLSFFSLALDTSWVYKGLERNRRVGAALVLGQVLFVGAVLVVVRESGDVVLVPLAQFFGEVSAALLLAVSVFRLGEIKPEIREGIRILRSSGLLTVSRLLRTLIYTFDVVLIGFLIGEREVGLYNAAYRICFLLVAIAVAVHSSYLPALTRAVVRDIKQVGCIAERSVNLAAAIAAPMIVGGIVLSLSLLKAIFGPEYVEGAGAFRLLLLSIGFVFIHGAMHNILLVSNRLKVEMWIMAVAAGLNIGLNIILIPRYGLVGAAFVTALAEGLVLLMMLFAIHKIGIRLDFQPVSRPLLAAGVMGASLIVFGTNRPLALCLGLGFVVYVFTLIVFRGIPQDAQPHLRDLASFANDLRVKFWKV